MRLSILLYVLAHWGLYTAKFIYLSIHNLKFSVKNKFLQVKNKFLQVFSKKQIFLFSACGAKELLLLDLEYADDTAVLFHSREHLIIWHFASFGMEVHSEKIWRRDDSKSVILFVSKPPSMYKDPNNYDNADLPAVFV